MSRTLTFSVRLSTFLVILSAFGIHGSPAAADPGRSQRNVYPASGYSDSTYQDPNDSYYYDDDYDDDGDIYYADWGGDAYDAYYQSALSPYGEWFQLPGYGYVWRPWSRSGWMPYSIGSWGWYGSDWMWISSEPFGYLTYHYGNWALLDGYGWTWFPGRTWAPHRVVWSSWGGQIGWAPRPPPNYRHYRSRSSRTYGNSSHYVWVANRNFLSSNISRHRQNSSTAWRGRGSSHRLPSLGKPARRSVERWTGRRVGSVDVRRVKERSRRGQVNIMVSDRWTGQRSSQRATRRSTHRNRTRGSGVLLPRRRNQQRNSSRESSRTHRWRTERSGNRDHSFGKDSRGGRRGWSSSIGGSATSRGQADSAKHEVKAYRAKPDKKHTRWTRSRSKKRSDSARKRSQDKKSRKHRKKSRKHF